MADGAAPRKPRTLSPLEQLAATFRSACRPDPLRSIDEWADTSRMLDRSTSAEWGQWKTSRVPYMREVMQALSPGSGVQRVVMMAGTQVAKTEVGLNMVGHAIDDVPGPCLIVQPRDTDAKQFSKMRLAKMINACPSLRGKVRDAARDSSNTLDLKEFPGGVLRLTGAQAPAGLRAMPVRNLFFDELDAAPLDCGGEGDPLDLAVNRTDTFGTRRKIYLCSTPTVEGGSRISDEYLAGDQRKYWVPCPHCGAFQVLKWGKPGEPGGVRYDDESPADAWYECEHAGCRIENSDKDWMLPRGEWRASNPKAPATVRSYWLSSLYSPHGWRSWGEIASKFLAAKGDPNKLKTWVNTSLAEVWKITGGEALSIAALIAGRKSWGELLPAGVAVLTAGVDVQDDRLEVEIVGWGVGEESWSVGYYVIDGDPALAAVWEELDRLLDEPRQHVSGAALSVATCCVDSAGHRTDAVYAYVRARASRNVWAIIGRSGDRAVFNSKPRRNNKGKIPLYIVGTDAAKESIYGRLRLSGAGPGVSHFPPDREESYFKGLCAERFERKRLNGRDRLVWTKPEGARNEPLDCRVYALAALRGWYAKGYKISSTLDRLANGGDDRKRGRVGKPMPALPSADRTMAPAKRKKGGWVTGGQAPTSSKPAKPGGWFDFGGKRGGR